MPDITMCTNEECPMKHKCYRYTAKPSEYSQSYGIFKPKKVSGVLVCERFIDNKI